MYIRTISRTNKDGSVVQYVQLAHNSRHPDKGYSKAEVIYSFGRRDTLDIEAIKRLVKSLSRFLEPGQALDLQSCGSADFKFMGSKPCGGAYLLRQSWKRLNLHSCLAQAISRRAYTAPIAEAIFAMVANRALAPSSKLSIEEWTEKDVFLGNDEQIKAQHCYRAMDFLLQHDEALQKEVFWSTANLLNLEVDLIFFDTTNTYFEIDEPGDSELKKYGHSKHKQDDLPQVTIGLAVTRKGIPVRCWVMPGNQSDAAAVDTIQRDLTGWSLGRVVWVMDRGMASEENRRILQRAGGNYILGEKLRGVTENAEALSRPGRYKTVRDNLRVKEVRLGEGLEQRRFVVVHNPDEATKDKASRERLVARIEAELAVMAELPAAKRKAAARKLLGHRSMSRFLQEKADGGVKLHRAKVREEERLDGKFLLSSSCETLSAEDIALGYKQLLDVERAFRTLKSSLDLRPVYHSKDERIRAHVLICWLALMLVRIAEVETGLSWDRIRSEMDRQHLGEFLGGSGRILQRTELNSAQLNILKKLKIKPPQIIERLDPTA